MTDHSSHPVNHIYLVGNPNTGKTTLFNYLTGLQQKTGNFPGVTVEQKSGKTRIHESEEVEVIDLPGTYSLYARTDEERVTTSILLDPDFSTQKNVLVLVLDGLNIQRNLLLATQVLDLHLPTLVVLNFHEEAQKSGKLIDVEFLSKALKCDIHLINARDGSGIDEVKKKIYNYPFNKIESDSSYRKHLQDWVKDVKSALEREKTDIIKRYQHILSITKPSTNPPKTTGFIQSFDKWAMHPVIGYAIFLFVLLIIFQMIFKLAEYPMNLIDESVSYLSSILSSKLPEGPLNKLLTQGVLPGLGGIIMFIPQIAFLSGIMAILEESGYMTRVIFLMDKIMTKVGLSGKSVVPLVSAAACAIPAIMSTRTISSWKERLNTILVIPLISCSARLPVYSILIALVIPSGYFGPFNTQGLVLFMMYLFGVAVAFIVAFILKKISKQKNTSFLILEMPKYRVPLWSSIGITVVNKSLDFVKEAGKIILAVSIILWALASYGPKQDPSWMSSKVNNYIATHPNTSPELAQEAISLEYSFAGYIGRWIEPAIKPIGYDWKIGIALVTSFAAREVFVGTISTIYSIGSDETSTVREKLQQMNDPSTGKKIIDIPTAISLLLFYALAMQCMSTLATVYKETRSWKWPVIQLIYMSVLAYSFAWVGYTVINTFLGSL